MLCLKASEGDHINSPEHAAVVIYLEEIWVHINLHHTLTSKR